MTATDAISVLSQQFYCGACRTWYPTDGASAATSPQLWTELQEHQDELHD